MGDPDDDLPLDALLGWRATPRSIDEAKDALRNGRARATDRFPGFEYLHGSSPRDILRRVADGDPLGIVARCAVRIRERAWLVAHDRLAARALAQVAKEGFRYRGEPALGLWLTEQIDAAARDLIDVDREEETTGVPVAEPRDARYELVASTFGISLAVARRACIVFNDLPWIVRHAYWAACVEGKSIPRYVAEGHGPRETAESRIRRALAAISYLRDPGGDDPPDDQRREAPQVKDG